MEYIQGDTISKAWPNIRHDQLRRRHINEAVAEIIRQLERVSMDDILSVMGEWKDLFGFSYKKFPDTRAFIESLGEVFRF